jgi:cytochrome P450
MTLPASLTQLPRPKGLPWLGNVLELELTQLPRVLEDWCRAHGPVYRFDMLKRTLLVIAAPELIQHILRERPDTYRRVMNIERALDSMGVTGVFSAEGEAWRKQRKFVNRALDREHLRHFFPTLCRVTERLKSRWQVAAREQREVDVQKELLRYTVDLTANLACGYDMNTLEHGSDVVQEQLEHVFPVLHRRVNAPFPYWRYFKLPADRKFEAAMTQLRTVIGDITTHAREQLANGGAEARPRNFLEAMLLAQSELSDHEVLGNVLTMLVAGEDTTANTLAWAFHYMCQNPTVQAQMQREADQHMGASELLGEMPPPDALPFIESVIHETTRLKPATPILFIEPNQDVELDGLRVPSGTPMILLTRFACIEDGEFRAAAQFQPERWLAHSPAPGRRGAFMPFGAGPRLCPGRSLALLEMKYALAMVSRNFTLHPVAGPAPVQERFEFVLTPENLRVKFEARN